MICKKCEHIIIFYAFSEDNRKICGINLDWSEIK